MLSSLIRSTIGRALALCLIFLLPLAQALELGAMSMAHMPARQMSSITFSTSPKSFGSFARKVGGVAFTTTATSTDRSVIVGFLYDADAPDGSRLRTRVKNADGAIQILALDAPDWIHIPLARLVATGDTGAVTLFGALKDVEQDRKLKEEQHAMIANYHPALENTLLGLRLLQADMLLIEKNATELFKDQGRYILGTGETAPSQQDLRRNQAGYMTVQTWLAKQPETFSSYVTGDIGSKIQYSIVEGALKVKGAPIWYCWRPDHKKIDEKMIRVAHAMSSDSFIIFSLADMEDRIETAATTGMKTVKVADRENDDMQELVFAKAMEQVVRKTASDILAHPQSAGAPTLLSRADLARAHAAGDSRGMAQLLVATLRQLQQLPANDTRLSNFNREFTGLREKRQQVYGEVAVIQMKKYSQLLSVEIRRAGGINSAVFDALQKSIQLAAVMRAAKAHDPIAYDQYIASIAAVPLKLTNPPGYALQTPTVYPRK